MGPCLSKCLASENNGSSEIPLIPKTVRFSTTKKKSDKTNENELSAGEEMLQKFIIKKILGVGSYGKVFLVEGIDDKNSYAMKLIKKSLVEKQNLRDNIMWEKDILASQDNSFIVKLYSSFQTQSNLYYILEFVPGGELLHHLKRFKKFRDEMAEFYAAEILLAIEHLHKKDIVYRDLKPENVLIGHDGHIKLTDFGLSKFLENDCIEKIK